MTDARYSNFGGTHIRMRIHPKLLGLAITGSLFTLLTVTMVRSRSLEKVIERRSRAPMVVVPDPVPDVADIAAANKPKTIAWYDSYHSDHGLRNSVSNADFSKCKGAAQNCKVIRHVIASLKQKKEVTADAVLFQGCHLYELARPERHHPSQIFVFAERENWLPDAYERIESNKSSSVLSFKDVFNWTMTYRRDSDILLPYGEIRKSSADVSFRSFNTVFQNKKYDAVWFVSHCQTNSHREEFVKEMQKYITVHIYGACGNLTCPRKEADRDPKNDCLKKIEEQYKFVLSFENAYHPDYVTEKLFDWFPRKIVPVVRGGGNYSNYGIPEGTIINADEYSSAKELSLYLKALGSNVVGYTAYIRKKQGFYTVSKDQKQTEGYCRLCEMLQNVRTYRKTYTHIGAWWDSARFSESYPSEQHSVKAVYLYIVLCNLAFCTVVHVCLVRKLMRKWS